MEEQGKLQTLSESRRRKDSEIGPGCDANNPDICIMLSGKPYIIRGNSGGKICHVNFMSHSTGRITV